MKEELENELYQIDPVFFEHAINCQEGKENETTTCMYFGCECGDGWFEPIKKLVEKTSILNKLAKEYNAKFVCDQLKEKWASFTCYYGAHLIDPNREVTDQHQIDILYSMFQEAVKKCEEECWNVCEWCGADGGRDGENLTITHGWNSRICRNCAKDKAEKETKHYDETHKLDHVPRITWFHEGYEFLNPYYVDGFNYKDNYYHSVIEAFYCEKDPMHKELYKKIVNDNRDTSPFTMEIIANDAYGIHMEESDYDLLKDIVKANFTYEFNEDTKKELLETEGKLLQNMGRHHNNIFGYCVCEECKNKEHKDLYAKILMEVRNELKNEA